MINCDIKCLNCNTALNVVHTLVDTLKLLWLLYTNDVIATHLCVCACMCVCVRVC